MQLLDFKGLKPLEIPNPIEWMTNNVSIPQKLSSIPGRFDISLTPYLKEIITELTTPYNNTREISFQKPTQCGGTLIYLLTTLYWQTFSPGAQLIVLPTEKAAKDIIGNRIRKFVDQNSPELLIKKYNSQSSTQLQLLKSDITAGWSNSATSLASKSIRYLILDEIAKYTDSVSGEAGSYFLAKERVKTYNFHKIFSCSTPVGCEDRFQKIYNNGVIRQYYVPCPYCGTYQVLDFERLMGFRDIIDINMIDDNIPVYYSCNTCDGRIEEKSKKEMINQGVWAEKNTTITPQGHVVGNSDYHHKSYHINGLYSIFQNWKDIAVEYLMSKEDPSQYQNFYNSNLGLPYTGEIVDLDYIVNIDNDNSEKNRRFKIENPDDYICTIGIDVQLDRIYTIVRVWDQDGHGYIYDYFYIDQEDHPDDIQETISTIKSITSVSQFKNLLIMIDSNYNDRKDDVYDFCRKVGTKIAIPIKGKFNPQYILSYGKNIDRNDKNFQTVLLDVNYFKDFYAKLQKQNKIHYPKDIDKSFLNQINSEKRTISFQKNGKQVVLWKKRDGFESNHYRDCDIYCLAALHHKNIDFFAKKSKKEKINILPEKTKVKIKRDSGFKIINNSKNRYL